jgi:hypothetical protein
LKSESFKYTFQIFSMKSSLQFRIAAKNTFSTLGIYSRITI